MSPPLADNDKNRGEKREEDSTLALPPSSLPPRGRPFTFHSPPLFSLLCHYPDFRSADWSPTPLCLWSCCRHSVIGGNRSKLLCVSHTHVQTDRRERTTDKPSCPTNDIINKNRLGFSLSPILLELLCFLGGGERGR